MIALAAMLVCWRPELPKQKQHWFGNFKQIPKIKRCRGSSRRETPRGHDDPTEGAELNIHGPASDNGKLWAIQAALPSLESDRGQAAQSRQAQGKLL